MERSNGIWTGSLCREIKLVSPKVYSGLFTNCLRHSLVRLREGRKGISVTGWRRARGPRMVARLTSTWFGWRDSSLWHRNWSPVSTLIITALRSPGVGKADYHKIIGLGIRSHLFHPLQSTAILSTVFVIVFWGVGGEGPVLLKYNFGTVKFTI